MGNNVLLLNGTDLLNAWDGSIDGVVDAVRRAFVSYANGSVLFPEKSSLIFNEKVQDRINCMPAAVKDMHRAGVKWVSVFPENPSLRGLPNVGGIMVLSDTDTGQTLSLMDAGVLTALRTSAVDALAARYLAPEGFDSLALIGTGEQAFYHARFLAPGGSGTTVRVSGRNPRHTARLVKRLLNVGINAIDFGSDMATAVSGSGVVVTAISGQAPVLKSDWIDSGMLYCHVGGWEDEFEVAKKADAIVCDDWDALKHRGSPTIARMYVQGLLTDKDIYANLTDIVIGNKPGRVSPDQFIYFNAIGLSFIDAAVADWLYGRSMQLEIGSWFDFLSKDESGELS